jgi:hypothetical protein
MKFIPELHEAFFLVLDWVIDKNFSSFSLSFGIKALIH